MIRQKKWISEICCLMRFAFVGQFHTVSQFIIVCLTVCWSIFLYFCLSCCMSICQSIFLKSWVLLCYEICFFLSMSYTPCLNLSLSSYMSVGLPVGLLVCSCLNFALLKDLLLSVNFALSVLIYHGLSDYMLIFLFVCLMVCLYIWLYVSLS